MVLSNMFLSSPYLAKWSNLTNLFQMGWSHQLEIVMHLYPTFRIGATNRCIDPTVDPGVDPAGMSLQECAEELMITWIHREPGSSAAFRSGGKTKKILQPLELNGRMTTNFSFLDALCTCWKSRKTWTMYRQHLLIGNPVAVKCITFS